jgi:TIR domain/NACHT domain/HEAT repeat
MEQASKPVNLFYSYAREDEELRNELENHLSLLQRRGVITAWHDRKIEPGEDWSQAIDRHLNESSIILLLISHHYLASDYCYNVEMLRALERHKTEEAQVIPILLSPADWHKAPFDHLRCLPRDDKPVTEWDNREAAFRHIAEELRRTIEQQRQIEESKEEDNRTKYLDYLMTRYRTVTLPFGRVEDFSLQAIFQPLTLRRDPLAAEDLQREKRRALLGETLPKKGDSHDEPVVVASTSQDALQKSPQKRMVILGGPGTGKSTVLQFLIAEQAQAARDDSAALLPIMVSLPDLSRSGKTLGEYLLRLTREAGVSDQFAVTLKKAIEGGQAFLCLDSLDEVSPDQRLAMIRTINEFASSIGNIWIIGSRFTEYKGGQFQRGQFTEWELQAMSSSLRRELARRLLPELYHLLKQPLGMVEEAPLAFVRLLEAHAQAAAWCENPLLFSLAAIVFVRLGTLPTSRAALYQQVIDAVLETREKDRLRRKVLLRVLSDLALGLYTAKGRTFSLDDLLDVLPSIRQRQHENWATDEIAQHLITSGMLDVLAHETYGFRHQTFQEYLAAVELAQRLISQDQALHDETWEFVWSKRAYSRWTEVLRLMVGTLTQRHRRAGAQKALDWLSELAGQQHEPEGDPGQLGLALALKSLAEVAGTTTPYWKEVGGSKVEEALVATWVSRLLDASHQGNTTQQRQLGNLCTDLVHLEQIIAKVAMERTRAALHDGDPRIRITAIRDLRSLGVCVPAEPLIAGLHDKEWSVRAAAAKALGVLRGKNTSEAIADRIARSA